MEEKIAELTKNLEIKKAQIAANDQHTGMITKETCGIALDLQNRLCGSWSILRSLRHSRLLMVWISGGNTEEKLLRKLVAGEAVRMNRRTVIPFPEEQ